MLRSSVRLIQYRHLRGVITGVALHAALHVAAHHRHRRGEIAGFGQFLRQITGIDRIGWRRGGQRAQRIGRRRVRALCQIAIGGGHLQIEIHALRQFAHLAVLAAVGNARQQLAGLLPHRSRWR